MAEPIALTALAIDATIGWPAWLYRWIGHPVGLFAWAINASEGRLNRGWPAARRIGGIATLMIVAGSAGTAGLAIEMLCRRLGGD